ncbi:hypothetical protein D9M68_652160 [compost metagenome]
MADPEHHVDFRAWRQRIDALAEHGVVAQVARLTVLPVEVEVVVERELEISSRTVTHVADAEHQNRLVRFRPYGDLDLWRPVAAGLSPCVV